VYRKSLLSNGVRVITESMPGFRSASIGIWADVGSAVEQPELRGVSHLVEHMLFKGTQRRTAREIAEEMDGVGGNLNAFTDKEALAELLERALAPLMVACTLPVPETPRPTPASLYRPKDSEQAYVDLGTTGLSVRDERRYVLSVLDTILGGAMSSRLFHEIR